MPGFSNDGAPFPRIRNVCPVCVPGGMRTNARPSTVGTSIFVPSAASVMVSGIVQWMLSPILLKKGCAAAFTTMYKSPAGPPKRPASPLPGNRIREPLFTPAGSATSMLSVTGIQPSPLQWPQRVIDLPEPPQSIQVTANCRCPFDRVVLPTPLQPAQGLSLE